MCVIVANSNGLIPRVAELRDMQNSNPDGIGIAWRSDDDHTIRFEKGITFTRMLQLLKFIQGRKCAYVLHFRITTIGGEGEKFCHPWPVETNMDTMFRLSGTADAVLAHNGTWSSWYKAVPSGVMVKRMIKQHWSDSAAMALLADKCRRDKSVLLDKFCKMVSLTNYGQRVCILSYDKGLQFFGRFELEGGIYFSNMWWSSNKWGEYWDNDEAPYLAAKPTAYGAYNMYDNYTACDLQSARNMGRISKRRYKKLMHRLARSASGNIVCAPGNTATTNNRAWKSDMHWSKMVFCENCGGRFSYTTTTCPHCHAGDGLYTHSSDPNEYESLSCVEHKHTDCKFASMCVCDCHAPAAKTNNLACETSMACEDTRHDDCLWKSCRCWCHTSCIHGRPIDDICGLCQQGSLSGKELKVSRSYTVDAIAHLPSCGCAKCQANRAIDKALNTVHDKKPMTHILASGNTDRCMHNGGLSVPCVECEIEIAKDATKWPAIVSQPREVGN